MFKKTIAVALTAMVSCLSSIAQGQPEKAASVKAQVQKIGTGERSIVRLKLKDGTERLGYVSHIENDSFTITDKATQKASSVSYGDVQSLKLKGKGLSIATKILIGVGIGVAITAGIIAYAATHLKF